MPELTQQVSLASAPFVGRWNRLISTTNWEKGRIVLEWRTALVEADAPANEYSDEAWASQVTGVSPQHVGRLRRAFEKFGAVHDDYAGLFWSHFQAALDWDDAELWLEGAVQNSWSVSQMRRQRWETLGAPDDLKPRDSDIIVAEFDEDGASAGADELDSRLTPSIGEAVATDDAYDDESASTADRTRENDAEDDDASSEDDSEPEARVRPFESLGDLPNDLADALESFKLAILRQRLEEWNEVTPDTVVAALDALKSLVTAPVGE